MTDALRPEFEQDPETAILWLLTDSNTRGATGALVGKRVFPHVNIPQNAELPAVLYSVIGVRRDYTHDGQVKVSRFRVQVSGYAETVSEVRKLKRAILSDLSGYQGNIPVSPTVVVQGCLVDNEADSAKLGLESSARSVKGKTLDFIVWIEE